VKPGATVTELAFFLRGKDETLGFTTATRMITFTGVGGGASVGFPVTIPLPSQTEFDTFTPRTFEDFNGGGAIIDGGASLVLGFSVMRGTVHPRTDPAQLDLGGFQLGLGIGAEFIGGEWKLIGGCF
jgi:hypothetical protein